MIYRFINSLFMGIAFISLLDFLYFIGLKLHYFDFYKINEYFNVLFVDNQNFYILLPISMIFGYFMIYGSFNRLVKKFYIFLVFIFISMLYEPIGKNVGEAVFLKPNQHFQLGSTTFDADLLYIARKNIYMYRTDLNKTIKLPKDEVIFLKASL